MNFKKERNFCRRFLFLGLSASAEDKAVSSLISSAKPLDMRALLLRSDNFKEALTAEEILKLAEAIKNKSVIK